MRNFQFGVIEKRRRHSDNERCDCQLQGDIKRYKPLQQVRQNKANGKEKQQGQHGDKYDPPHCGTQQTAPGSEAEELSEQLPPQQADYMRDKYFIYTAPRVTARHDDQ